jgi:hypothetical protein
LGGGVNINTDSEIVSRGDYQWEFNKIKKIDLLNRISRMVKEIEIERWRREDERNMEQALEKFSNNVGTKFTTANEKVGGRISKTIEAKPSTLRHEVTSPEKKIFRILQCKY